MERYLRVNLLGPGPSSYKKRIYRSAVSQRLGNTELDHRLTVFCNRVPKDVFGPKIAGKRGRARNDTMEIFQMEIFIIYYQGVESR
jgi:hypothetical protein